MDSKMGHPGASQARMKTSSAPKADPKAKHSRSGSVSNISISSNDFSSPTGDKDTLGSPGSFSSSSLKEKRIKRRTRSSLGGTEDFIKELDFLTSSSGKKTDLPTPKELPKPSLKTDPKTLPVGAEAISPVLEVPLAVPAKGTGDDPLVELAHGTAADKGDDGLLASAIVTTDRVTENGSSPDEQELVNSAQMNGICSGAEGLVSAAPTTETLNTEKIGDILEISKRPAPPDGAGPEFGEGAGVAGTGRMVELSTEDAKEVVDGLQKDEADCESPSMLKEGISLAEPGVALESVSPVEESGPPHLADKDIPASIICEAPRPAQSSISVTNDASEAMISTRLEYLKDLGISESKAAVGDTVVLVAVNGDSEVSPTKTEAESAADDVTLVVPPDSQISPTKPEEVKDVVTLVGSGDSHISPKTREVSKVELDNEQRRLEEKERVSVQKRIEELERKAGGKPVHFRSQSLSLPRSLNVCHASHHEAEDSQGFKLPLYKAPLDSTSVEEHESCSVSAEVLQDDEELTQGDLQGSLKASSGTSLPGEFAVECSAECVDIRNGLDNGEGNLKGTLADQRLDGVEPDTDARPGPKEVLRAAIVDLNSDINDTYLHTVLTDGLPVTASNGEESLSVPAEAGKESESREENGVGVAKEDGEVGNEETKNILDDSQCAESGPGVQEKSLVVCAGTVPKRTLEDQSIAVGVPMSSVASEGGTLKTAEHSCLVKASKTSILSDVVGPAMGRPYQDDEASVLLPKQPAVDPLFVDSPQDRLWEMHSQELALTEGDTSVQEVRESSAQDEDHSQYLNGSSEAAATSASTSVGNSQPDKSNKMDRPRTPLRSLLAEEEAAEKSSGPDSGVHSSSTTPQNPIVSPRGNLFRRIVSGGRGSPTTTTPSNFSPKNQTPPKPFLSSCICCSPVK